MGYNFQLDIIFYNISGNQNVKMIYKIYIYSIVKSIVEPWIVGDYDFILKKDSDFGYSTSKINLIKE